MNQGILPDSLAAFCPPGDYDTYDYDNPADWGHPPGHPYHYYSQVFYQWEKSPADGKPPKILSTFGNFEFCENCDDDSGLGLGPWILLDEYVKTLDWSVRRTLKVAPLMEWDRPSLPEWDPLGEDALSEDYMD